MTFVAAALGVACAPANPAGAPAPVGGRAMSSDEIATLQRRGSPVDTIAVQPLRVELRVGDTFPIGGFALVARDTAGRIVRTFSPTFIVATPGVVEITRGGLRGVAPGTAALYVEALPREPARQPTPRRPSTRVDVLVRP